MDTIVNDLLQKQSIFRVGEVLSVNGREVCIKVDKNKNLSHLLYKGEIIKNVSVGSYLNILKGFVHIVAKVESEYIKENNDLNNSYHNKNEEISRTLVVKLIGYFENGLYYKGVKELPLIGNECLLMDNREFSLIHKFAKDDELTIEIGHLLSDSNVPIEISINKLFSSHIGIFGNTGSGKSYSLAGIYKKLFDRVSANKRFQKNAKFILFDFNGEYSKEGVITDIKKSYKLCTRNSSGNKIPLKKEDLLNPELFYILASATEKTQQPFIKRTLLFYQDVQSKDQPNQYFKGVMRKQLKSVLEMPDHTKAKQLLDYFEQILPQNIDEFGLNIGLQKDLEWHGTMNSYYIEVDGSKKFFNTSDGKLYIKDLSISHAIDTYTESENFIDTIIRYLYIQLIGDVINNRAVNEHIAPAINKLKALMKDFDKVFVIDNSADFWDNNYFIVIDLNDVDINMKKLIPLLISFKLYTAHKKLKIDSLCESLNIIVDEAHNILSYESMRESESWKDFRLETFEEIIKEGRKFGVFLTIASQRPSDISSTIISQLHNYLIHRLINNRDLEMVEKAVSYLDKLSIESLPILPVGACVLSGVIADLPIIVQMDRIEKHYSPQSDNIDLIKNWIDEVPDKSED
jgi:DNA helicase HerA-like ATPase